MKRVTRLLIFIMSAVVVMTGAAGTKAMAAEANAPAENESITIEKDGWTQTSDGIFYYKNGTKCTGLQIIAGKKYYFNSNGKLQTGMKTIKVNGKKKTYYFTTSGKPGKIGAAKSGWVTYKKYCYYFDKKTFEMKKNTVVNSYKLDKNGRSETRYLILKLVKQHTKASMTDNQKIKALFTWLTENSWKYINNYEFRSSKWKWYKGWTDDYAKQIIKNKGGNCFRYACVLGYMVREATGLPVRIYRGKTHRLGGGLTEHGWITVKIKGKWYVYDPDLWKFDKHKSLYYKTLYSKAKNMKNGYHQAGKKLDLN